MPGNVEFLILQIGRFLEIQQQQHGKVQLRKAGPEQYFFNRQQEIVLQFFH
jgi:hypothetical protein